MARLRLPGLAPRLLVVLSLWAGPAGAASELARCLEDQGLVRVARVLLPGGAPEYARVVAQEDGILTAVVPVAGGGVALADVLRMAADAAPTAPVSRIAAGHAAGRICAPFRLGQDEIDAHARVVVAAGLNYAAHAEEAGGGDVFLFPKPVAPSPPYGELAVPAGVRLLDYEVELAFVLLADVDLGALPSREELLARSAFFVANDVTDRELIIRHKTLSGLGTGFVDAKGQSGFLPAGPWLVRGSELFAGLAACGASGLGIRLDVDEGDGFRSRQNATTAAMILDPLAFLARIGDEVTQHGVRSPMPLRRPGEERFYPLAVANPSGGNPILPAGSVVLMGTPDGVALRAPDPIGVVARGLLRLRGPFEQFREEELARAAAGGPGGYLEPGDRVRAQIDGLGSQLLRIAETGAVPGVDPCGAQREVAKP